MEDVFSARLYAIHQEYTALCKEIDEYNARPKTTIVVPEEEEVSSVAIEELKRPAAAAPPEKPAKNKRQKLPANPKCKGNFAKGSACEGGVDSGRMTKLDELDVCLTCYNKIKRHRKKNDQ